MGHGIEQTIIDAAIKSQAFCQNITGEWLCQSPEFLLTCKVAFAIAQSGYYVSIDKSNDKIEGYRGLKRGKKSDNSKKRPDICVYYKTNSDTPMAIVEIKKCYRNAPVLEDAKKIQKNLYGRRSAKTGYILLYSSAIISKNKEKKKLVSKNKTLTSSEKEELKKNLNDLFVSCKQPGWKLVDPHIKVSPKDYAAWGVALLRYDKKA